jgi:plasmid stability protein
MATLQVRDIDSKLYNALRAKAKADHRSVSQEVVHIIEDHLSKTNLDAESQSRMFLGLTNAWIGPETAEEIIKNIKQSNVNSERYKDKHVTFD